MAEKHERDMTRAEWLEHIANQPLDKDGPSWDEWKLTLPERTRRALEDTRPRDAWGFLLSPSTETDSSPPSEAGAKKSKRHPNQPSKDRQSDIVAAIVEQGVPLHRDEVRKAMRLKTEGKLGHSLAWMVKNGVLIKIPGRGYWPAGREVPE